MFTNKNYLSPHLSCSKNTLMLPRFNPTSEFFITFENSEHFFQLLKLIIKIKSANQKINVVISEGDQLFAYEYFNKNNFHLQNQVFPLTVPGDNNLWLRDQFKFINSSSGQALLEIPYSRGSSGNIGTSIALNQKITIIEQPRYYLNKEVAQNGDYGGNMLPLDHENILIGNTMTNTMKDHLKKLTSQQFIEIDTQWILTEHVDEIFSPIPVPGSGCKFILAYSSPALGIQILNSLNNGLELIKKGNTGFADDVDKELHGCLENIDLGDRLIDKCPGIFAQNLKYSKIINSGLNKVLKKIKKSKCELVATVPFPMIWQPITYSLKNNSEKFISIAKPALPNPINNIFLNNTLILPKQNNIYFEREIVKNLKPYNIKYYFANADIYHSSDGGLHCATNTKRQCLQ